MSKSSARGAITLKGSATIVAEYFGFAMNSILFLRGVYDPDSFTTVKKYNLRLSVTTDDRLADYIKQILKQLTHWLADGSVRKLVLVLQSVDTQETIERWVFNVETNQEVCFLPFFSSLLIYHTFYHISLLLSLLLPIIPANHLYYAFLLTPLIHSPHIYMNITTHHEPF